MSLSINSEVPPKEEIKCKEEPKPQMHQKKIITYLVFMVLCIMYIKI